MSKLEVVDFSDTDLSDIENQDNPIFGEDECMLLVQGYEPECVGVLYIKPDKINKAITIAEFLRKCYAIQFCENFKPVNEG